MTSHDFWLCTYISGGVTLVFMYSLFRSTRTVKKAMKPVIIKKC